MEAIVTMAIAHPAAAALRKILKLTLASPGPMPVQAHRSADTSPLFSARRIQDANLRLSGALRRRQVMIQQQRQKEPHQVRDRITEHAHRNRVARRSLEPERMPDKTGIEERGRTEVDNATHAHQKRQRRD